jgi:hypothetical protein
MGLWMVNSRGSLFDDELRSFTEDMRVEVIPL